MRACMCPFDTEYRSHLLLWTAEDLPRLFMPTQDLVPELKTTLANGLDIRLNFLNLSGLQFHEEVILDNEMRGQHLDFHELDQ